MIEKIKTLLVVVIFLSIFSCGGVVGNIQMDGFSCDTITFKKCFDGLYEDGVLFKPDSSSAYRDEGEEKVALIIHRGDTLAFVYEIRQAANRRNMPMLIITHFAKNGEVLEFESSLSNNLEDKADEVYFERILPKLKECNCLVAH